MNTLWFGLRIGIELVLFLTRKHQVEKTPKYHGAHQYCILFKKLGMHKQNYMSHISENCFSKRSIQQSINDGMGRDLDNRSDAVNQYNKYEQKQKKELKALSSVFVHTYCTDSQHRIYHLGLFPFHH